MSLFKRLRTILKDESHVLSQPDVDNNESNRTVKKWDRSDSAYSTAGFKEYWELLEDVQQYQALMMTKGRDIFGYIASFFPEGKKMSDLNGLIIGCMYGEESPVITIAKTGVFRKILIVDVARGLLKSQEQITHKAGLNHIIEYRYMDLNTESLSEQNRYDFVFSVGTIHHISRLEGLFKEINDVLREDGIFAMREYIGPSYLQFTEKQLRISNRILEGLPDYLKMQKDGKIKNRASKSSLEEIIADDPSEAVRSQDIMAAVESSLEVLTSNMTGGTLLNPLLHAIAGNFEKGVAERAVLKTIIAMEQTLIEEHVIPSDYILLVARKRS